MVDGTAAVPVSQFLVQSPTALPDPAIPPPPRVERPAGIAVVGMSAMLPKAANLQAYWENILNKVDAIVEIPKDRWDWKLYYDPDPKAPDKIYSRWGGFIDDVPFDPIEYGMPPSSLPSIDPMQLLALKAARLALDDAGYAERPFDRSRASVILGASGGSGDLGTAYLLRAGLPLLFGEAAREIVARADGILPQWTEDSFAGLLLNVAAGRIANRLDFGGLNYVVDAACASSLSAVRLAVKELQTGSTDLVLTGGFDTTQNPFGYLCFSKTRALSPTGQPRTFDASADGIAIGEGVVMLVLKRLADAERDGDRIYAVIRGVEGSSDGKAKGLTAPRPEGQVLALERTYAEIGVSPTTVGLFEAHGTGTVVGDQTEALALSTFLGKAGASPCSAAIGSVKSMIGHTKAAAGAASLAKVALALYHRILPPTLGVTQPNPSAGFGDGPLYINSETRPWIDGTQKHPRRAGVSAFGFGGTNFHALLEEYRGRTASEPMPMQQWPTELFLWSAGSRRELLAQVTSLESELRRGARPRLRDLAYSLWQVASQRWASDVDGEERLAIVARSFADLSDRLGQAVEGLGADEQTELRDPRGIYFAGRSPVRDGRLAIVFPGRGSQYPNMLRELAVMFPEIREEFERADRVLETRFTKPLSHFIFPPPGFSADEARARDEALAQENVALPAIGAASAALYRLLRALGVAPDLLGGHGSGELVALHAAGAFDSEALARLSEATGRDLGMLRQCLSSIELRPPAVEVFSGATAAPYPREPRALVAQLEEHVLQPVRGVDQLERVYEAGARIFVEAGPRDILTGLVRRTLGDRPHAAIAVDIPGRSGLSQLQHALGQLAVNGVPVDLGLLFRGRTVRRLNPGRLEDESKDRPVSPTTWFVNGGRARPPLPHARDSEPQGAEVSRPAALSSAAEGVPAVRLRETSPVGPPPTMPSIASPAETRAAGSAPSPSRSEETRPRSAAPREDPGQVMLEFQGLMTRFLEAQHNVMAAYFHGKPPAVAAPVPAKTTPAAASSVSAEPDGPRVPASGSASQEATTSATAHEAPALGASPSRDQLTRRLREIVSARTGYPEELLDLDVDIEADLGIDSIKRVEILGAVQQACMPGDARLLQDEMEKLARVKTLRGIVRSLESVVGAGAAGDPGATGEHGPRHALLPLLHGGRFSAARGDVVELVRVLDPLHDLWLKDHVLDGKPVLPAAVAMEFMAEVAQGGWPELKVVGLRDVRVFRGVVVDKAGSTLRVVARALPEAPARGTGVSVQVEIRSAEAPGHAYYRGTVDLARELAEPPLHRPRLADELGPFPMTVEEAYRRWLFHGPVLQGITDIHGISGQGVVATCRSSSPGECLSGDPPGQWLIDPVVCDSGLQLILLWARARHDLTALPSHLREYRRFRPLTGPSIRCFMDARVMPDGHVIRANLAFVSEDGRVAGVLEDLECTGSKALNRLAGGHRRL